VKFEMKSRCERVLRLSSVDSDERGFKILNMIRNTSVEVDINTNEINGIHNAATSNGQ